MRHPYRLLNSNGVYKYDGENFKKYSAPISIMGIMNDKNGNLWFAGAGGLYKINQNEEIGINSLRSKSAVAVYKAAKTLSCHFPSNLILVHQ